jgi:TPR repeat protein
MRAGLTCGVVGTVLAALVAGSPVGAQKNEGMGVLKVPPTPPLEYSASVPATSSITELDQQARIGTLGAIWKLGRMYAEGDGVTADKGKAFAYFQRLANEQSNVNPTAPEAALVANAFVRLGQYYLDGIPGTVNADPGRAREMFQFAASYFASPEAQYQLGKLYLDGTGVPKNPLQAARWLQLAANKGEYRAQALLGSLLFKGEGVPRQAARGLFWLTLAKDAAKPDETWIAEAFADASARASDAERAGALQNLEDWLKNPRQ